ncbi:MAG TPA: ATP-binding protein [Vicinamibacterales bacterium]
MELLDRLAAHEKLAGTPRDQLAWLADHGRLLRFEAGGVMPRAQRVDSLWIVLTGHLSIRIQRSTGSRKVMEWHAGDFAGFLPYSRLREAPGDVTAEETTEVLSIHRDHFREMARECHELTTVLVHAMLDRARVFQKSEDLHDEKLKSLGRVSAGLAHELNNPASAVVRTAEALSNRLTELERVSRAVGMVRLPETQLAALDRAKTMCVGIATTTILSPVERADREEMLEGWLEQQGLDQTLAESLVDTPLEVDVLNELKRDLDAVALDLVIRYLGMSCTTRRLAEEIERAASRIFTLVAAVKRFTYRDQPAVPEPVDIARGLSDTVAILGAKARARAVGVKLDVAPALPQVQGYGGELNQVWLNLIDNAIDAVPSSGQVEVTARHEGDSVVVRVTDNGPGIPQEFHDDLFDPFFTTKPVGQGQGLGLSTARALIEHHKGVIDFRSQPGRTEFAVTLPIFTPAAI